MRKVDFTSKDRKELGENKKITNILQLLYMLLIQDNENIEYYAAKLDCSVPTIKKYMRDIKNSYEAFHSSGFDIHYDRKDNKYRLKTNVKFPAFSSEEIEALHMAVKYLSGQYGTPFQHLKEIEKKLDRFFTKGSREKVKKPMNISSPETKSSLNNLIDGIDEAINNKKKLVLEYIPTYHKDTVSREVVPYELLSHDYEWYIRGFCLEDKIFKTFSINQIESMEIKELNKEERNLIPQKPDSLEHMWDWSDGSPTEVIIQFGEAMAERMRKKLTHRKEHPSQEIHMSGDRLIVSFKVKNPPAMIPWIFQFGSRAEVLKPEGLKDKIKMELSNMGKVY